MTSEAQAAGWQRTLEFSRFLLAGLLNMGVGYCAFALLVYLGLNLFAAQAGGHVIGTAFNYFSHSRFVFRMKPKLLPYLGSSAINYLTGLLILAVVAQVVASPYWAGLIATACTAIASYVSFKLLAFRRHQRTATSA